MKVPFLDLKLQHQPLRAEVMAALGDTYDNTRFCLGKDVDDFEKAFSATFGFARTLGMNSGTSPLHIASICGGFGPGDEIITTPFTFASSCWGISYVGATPVFVDIDADTWCISPEAIAKAITPKTKGIVVGVPQAGDDGLCAGEEERADEIGDPFLALELSNSSITGRESNKVGGEAQISDLAVL